MKRQTFLFVFIIFLPLILKSQVHFPIRTTTIVTPPVPFSLDGFVSQSGKLVLNIMVDDVTLSQYPVKLRLHIEGNGIRITTNPNLPQSPIYLDGGVSVRLTGPELESYFNPSNLLFQGYSLNEYRRNGRLPEGVYRIRFEVYDYYRDFSVASAIPGIAMLSLTSPPVLTFPGNRSEFDIDANPLLRFSWMAVFSAIPEASIQYKFRLWQIRPDGRDPYEIIRVTVPLYETTTSETALLYDGALPPLTRGNQYVWQVEAIDETSNVLFKNDGVSDAFTFRYGCQCEVPDVLIAEVSFDSVVLTWNRNTAADEYIVRYRVENADEWEEKTTTLVEFTLDGLASSTKYEAQVIAGCGAEVSENSRTLHFKTDRNVDYTCGAGAPVISFENQTPLPVLSRFDEFKAADFYIEVTEVTGTDGEFSGKGLASVPFLNFIQFQVEFNNIRINTDFQMIDGKVVFIYDEATGMIIGGDWGGNGADSDSDDEAISYEDALATTFDQIVTLNEEVADVTVNNGQVTVTTESGQIKTYLVGESQTLAITSPEHTVVVDEASGQVFQMPGQIPGSASNVRTPSQSGDYSCQVSFSPAGNQRFGFDRPGNGIVKPDGYFLHNHSGDIIPWKSLEAGNTDYVSLRSSGDCPSDSLRFIRESGLLTPSSPGDNNTLQLLLTGGPGEQEEQLTVAKARSQYINDSTTNEILTDVGDLALVSYNRLERNVVLVPVNNSSFPSQGTDRSVIVKRLNEIYGPAVVNWNVSIDTAIEVLNINEADFIVEGTALLSKYTSDMNRVIRTYKRDRVTDNNTLYLFFMTLSNLGSSRKGFMPLAGNYGFIFNFEAQDLELLAHELAHGAFNLRHTFSDKSMYYFTVNQTANLMDYAGGVELWKYQWDLIHNPESILFAWAQDEEEGAMMDLNMSKESIKGVVDLIRESNIGKKEIADLSLFSLSKGSCINLELTDDFTLEYIEVKIGSGKNLGDQDNPFLCEPLTISPMGLNSVNIATPASQNGDFVQIYFNRLEQAAPPRSGIVESDNVGVSFVIKEAQRDEFEAYLNNELRANATWVSQFNSTVFGDCTCFRSSCCFYTSQYIVKHSTEFYSPNGNQIAISRFPRNNAPLIDLQTPVSIPSGFTLGVAYLDARLAEGKPIVVGVYYRERQIRQQERTAEAQELLNIAQAELYELNNEIENIEETQELIELREEKEQAIEIAQRNFDEVSQKGPFNSVEPTFHYVVVVGKGYDTKQQREYYRYFEVGTSVQSNGTHKQNRFYIYDDKLLGSQGFSSKEYIVTEVRQHSQSGNDCP